MKPKFRQRPRSVLCNANELYECILIILLINSYFGRCRHLPSTYCTSDSHGKTPTSFFSCTLRWCAVQFAFKYQIGMGLRAEAYVMCIRMQCMPLKVSNDWCDINAFTNKLIDRPLQTGNHDKIQTYPHSTFISMQMLWLRYTSVRRQHTKRNCFVRNGRLLNACEMECVMKIIKAKTQTFLCQSSGQIYSSRSQVLLRICTSALRCRTQQSNKCAEISKGKMTNATLALFNPEAMHSATFGGHAAPEASISSPPRKVISFKWFLVRSCLGKQLPWGYRHLQWFVTIKRSLHSPTNRNWLHTNFF